MQHYKSTMLQFKIRQEKEIKCKDQRKEEIKISLFVDNMMIFIEFSEISKVLESIVLVQQENRI